ncbi:hypothetical protein MSPP1_002314 [Malassezia sp. CBS 17886]|nr:hypothetical protein MSPP1_002314 [Malassezia sp. CBS 17886]
MADSTALALGPHPLGLRPLGNALMQRGHDTRRTGLGALARMDDSLLILLLTEYVDDAALCRFAATSRMAYALASMPSVWRERYFIRWGACVLQWCGSWRGTYVARSGRGRTDAERWRRLSEQAARFHVSLRGVYSDAVYRAFLTAAFQPLAFLQYHGQLERRRAARFRKSAAERADRGLMVPDVLERISARTTSHDAFMARFARENRPCIIAHATDDWPCRRWTLDYVAQHWAQTEFQAEAVRMHGATYIQYARSPGGGAGAGCLPGTVPDTSPYYLFDAEFAACNNEAADGWRVPDLLARILPYGGASGHPNTGCASTDEHTQADLFSLFQGSRPDYRWLIAGPARSGSCGSKYWMLLPPCVTPPGVFVNEDESEVTAPASLSEWMLDHYAETKRWHGRRELGGDGLLVDGVCHEGEVMYVPSGWWHLVVNLDESVALTQNFVSVAELPAVLAFMKHKPEQVSGFKTELAPTEPSRYDAFKSLLNAYSPDLAARAIAEADARAAAPMPRATVDWRERLRDGGEQEGAHSGASGGGFALAIEADELGELPW